MALAALDEAPISVNYISSAGSSLGSRIKPPPADERMSGRPCERRFSSLSLFFFLSRFAESNEVAETRFLRYYICPTFNWHL